MVNHAVQLIQNFQNAALRNSLGVLIKYKLSVVKRYFKKFSYKYAFLKKQQCQLYSEIAAVGPSRRPDRQTRSHASRTMRFDTVGRQRRSGSKTVACTGLCDCSNDVDQINCGALLMCTESTSGHSLYLIRHLMVQRRGYTVKRSPTTSHTAAWSRPR